MTEARRETLLVRGLFILMTLLWGLGFVVVRLMLGAGVPPLLGGGRFLVRQAIPLDERVAPLDDSLVLRWQDERPPARE